MAERIIYISRNCPHCKKLLLGIHKYDFLRNQFQLIDVQTQRYPDYIQSVPTMVIDQRMIKNDDVFGYMNNMVEQIFQQNPQLKEKYHPQRQGQMQGQGQGQMQGQSQMQGQQRSNGSIGQAPQKTKGPDYDPIDDLVGWCPDGGCSFSPISESNDDCSIKKVSLDDNNMFSFIQDTGDIPPQQSGGIQVGNDNTQFQKSSKQQKMDESYERLMAERRIMN